MNTALKVLSGVVALVVVAVIAILLYVVFAMDPNDYKGDIENIAAQQGVDLSIEGDLEWNLFPNLAIRVGETRMSSEQRGLPASSFRRADLVLGWWPLLQRRVEVGALKIDGADLHLENASQGAAVAAAPGTGARPVEVSGSPFSLAIDQFELSDSRVTLLDEAGNTVLDNLNLSSNNVSLTGEPFPVSVAFDYSGPLSPNPVSIGFDNQTTFNESAGIVTLADNQLSVTGLMPAAFNLDFNASVDLKAESAEVKDIRGSLGPMAFSAHLEVADYGTDLAASGNLELDPFDLKAVATDWFGMPLDTAADKAFTRVGLSTDFAATLNRLSLDNLALRLDDTTVRGNMRLGMEAPRDLQLSLAGDNLNASDYLPAAEDTDGEADKGGTGTEAAALFAPILGPLAILEGGNGDINFAMDSVDYDGLTLEALELAMTVRGRVLNLQTLSTNVFGGGVDASGKLDFAGNLPRASFRKQVADIDIAEALAFVDPENEPAITGRATLNIQGETEGSDPDALFANLVANGDFRVEQPTITTINIERSYCELAALVENQPKRTEPWPQGTSLRTLTGNFRLRDQILHLDKYDTAMGNLDLRGDGQVDIGRERFDVMVITRLNGDRTSEAGCPVKSKRIRDRDIPLRCRDSFADAGATSCKPDQAFINRMIQDEVIDRIRGRSGDSEGKEGKDSSGDAVEGLLRGILGR